MKQVNPPALPALWVAAALFGSLAFAQNVRAQITINGVEDKTVYADSVTLRVPSAPGYEYTARLIGEPVASERTIPTDTDVVVNAPEFYELKVERKQTASGNVESRSVRFIVRSSERRNSEWGLAPWVPYPSINSAAAEFAGAHLVIVAPRSYPQGLEIPIVAWVEDAQDRRVGVNGWVGAAEVPGFKLHVLRGVGSGFLAPVSSSGALSLTARIGPLENPRQIAIEETTAWTNAAGSLAASADWGEDARVRITGALTIPAGRTLTIGAGSVIVVGPGVDLNVNGKLVVAGTRDRPVVFTAESRSAPWGGIVAGLRPVTAQAELEITGAILTAGGSNPDFFDDNPGSGDSHLSDQPLVYVSNNARAVLTDTHVIEGRGQATHGEDSSFTMNRCLLQRFKAAGQFNDCTVRVDRSAVIEFPGEAVPFADDDGDALYFIGGDEMLTNSLFGWTHDDSLDAGSGGGSPVKVTGCWFESAFHEGTAWSGGSAATPRRAEVRDTVVINCGQGIECGWDYPMVTVDHCLSTANLVGARLGDNYDWDYFGRLNIAGSYLLYNVRNIWGRAWDGTALGWEHHLSQMDIKGNAISEADLLHPDNSVWQPAADASALAPFLPAPAATVGMGIALRSTELDIARLADGVPVRLSTFTTVPVSARYRLEADGSPLGEGTLDFAPGESVKTIRPDAALLSLPHVRVAILDPANAELTDVRQVDYYRFETVVLVAAGSSWRYFDKGQDLGSGWREPAFADGSWAEGAAELGFGDGAITTTNGGPSDDRFPTTYFRGRFTVDDPALFHSLTVRLKRDDGAVVHLNGKPVLWDNIDPADVKYGTWAESSVTGADENAFFTHALGAEELVQGENLIAVEVHQVDDTSSDLSFDLELQGLRLPALTGSLFARGDGNGDGAIDIADALVILFHLFAGIPGDCRDALDADDSGVVGLADALRLLDYLFQEGAAPADPFPGQGPDPTPDELDCARASG